MKKTFPKGERKQHVTGNQSVTVETRWPGSVRLHTWEIQAQGTQLLVSSPSTQRGEPHVHNTVHTISIVCLLESTFWKSK